MKNKTLYSKEDLLRQYDDYMKLGIENIENLEEVKLFRGVFSEIHGETFILSNQIRKKINNLMRLELIGKYYKSDKYDESITYICVKDSVVENNLIEYLLKAYKIISNKEGNSFFEIIIEPYYLNQYEEITKEEWMKQLEILENNLEEFIKKTIL